jgi:IS5 family transposase
VVHRIHERVVDRARREGIARGRKLRTDTTVVESNIHYPTDSALLQDGVRVLARQHSKGDRGFARDVGWSVVTQNLVAIARTKATRAHAGGRS